MKSDASLLKSVLLWTLLVSLAASLYGILNDQVTVTLSPEYFSVFKQRQFSPLLSLMGLEQSPLRLRAIFIGVASSCWFGAIAGLLLSLAGRKGRMPPLSSCALLKSVGLLLRITLYGSLCGGVFGMFVGRVVAPENHATPLAVLIVGWGIRDYQSAVLVSCWHTGAYVGCMVGVLLALRRIGHFRRHMSQQDSAS